MNPHFIMSAGSVLAQISHLENLTWLQIDGRYSLYDEDLSHLSRLPNLTTLRLIYGYKLTDNCLLYLARLENLTSLDVLNITAQGIQQLINKRYSYYRADVLNYFKESSFLVDDLHPIIGDYLTLPPLKAAKSEC